ncbi:hypothetical protein ACJIZ3_022719 [Penstemon smallii]|uniref:tRNA N(3)-methylcytidine methyltransferase n=1 Tax=Penstemon smallii TaxID=265156 RepID=A0ABD3TPY8_9LAMI
MNKIACEAANYYSKDFDWEQLRKEVESDLSIRFHLLPYSSKEIVTTQNQNSEAWDKFHARHSTGKFFKERRYLLKEFPELACCNKDYAKVLEVGCGNGSTALPLLRYYVKLIDDIPLQNLKHGRRYFTRGLENIVLYACDCSNEALERTKELINATIPISAKNRFRPFQCDFSTTDFPSWLAYPVSDHSHKINDLNPFCSDENNCIGGVDFVTLIFTLSALPLDKMAEGIARCFAVLKPGGLLLFRDYGLYDMTMLRFEAEQRVGYREYLRSDGTCSYFFCLDTVRNLTSAAGFNEVELEYCCVKSLNRRNGKTMKRVWVHGKFQKPVTS